MKRMVCVCVKWNKAAHVREISFHRSHPLWHDTRVCAYHLSCSKVHKTQTLSGVWVPLGHRLFADPLVILSWAIFWQWRSSHTLNPYKVSHCRTTLSRYEVKERGRFYSSSSSASADVTAIVSNSRCPSVVILRPPDGEISTRPISSSFWIMYLRILPDAVWNLLVHVPLRYWPPYIFLKDPTPTPPRI